MEVAKKYQDLLVEFKNNIESSYRYDRDNRERFHDFRRFVCKTSISNEQRLSLDKINRPPIQSNVIEAYISRQLGEFSQQEPSIYARPIAGDKVDSRLIKIIEDHFRHILDEAKKDNTQWKAYQDGMLGGFSVLKVYTDYVNEMSFDQKVCLTKVDNPTLCGFDNGATKPHKGDGRYCFETHFLTKTDFEKQFKGYTTSDIAFSRSIGGYTWSFSNGNDEDIVAVADYYYKKDKEVSIVKLVTGQVIAEDEYVKLLDEWPLYNSLSPPPEIIGKPRKTTITKICRAQLCENKVLTHEITDFRDFPLIFYPFNSVMVKDEYGDSFTEMTRPYAYHARDAQILKNVCMQYIGDDIQSQVAHKFMIPKRGIPEDQKYLDAYENLGIASTIVYEDMDEAGNPIPSPREIQRVPIPQEVMQTYLSCDQTIQSILGSYDAALGINQNQLSGVAIVNGATQSNAAAMPGVVNYMNTITQVANVILGVMPSVYENAEVIPTLDAEGNRNHEKINNYGDVSMKFHPSDLHITVEAGVNSEIQKMRSMDWIQRGMQSSQVFGQFISDECLDVLVANLPIKDGALLEDRAREFMKKMQQQKQQAQMMQAQAAQNNPLAMQAKNQQMQIQVEAQNNMMDARIKEEQLAIKKAELSLTKQKLDNETLKIFSDMKSSETQSMAQMAKADAENSRTQVDMLLKTADLIHKHEMNIHNINTRTE